jgi:hypothetical protein
LVYYTKEPKIEWFPTITKIESLLKNKKAKAVPSRKDGKKRKLKRDENETSKHNIHKDKKNKKEIYKMILLVNEFSCIEFMQLFMDFVKEFDEDMDFQSDFRELINIVEFFCQDCYLGPLRMQTLLYQKGVDCPVGEYEIIGNRDKPLRFSKNDYKRLYDEIWDDQFDYVSIQKFLPFMFLFNLSKRFLEIEERNKRFWKFWGDDSKVQNSLIKLFQKHGMDVDKLKMTQITYEMTEKVVIDVRNQFPEAFSYEQIQIVMEKIKEKMEVDKISTLQKHRKWFVDDHELENNELSFSKWLCLELLSQIWLNELKLSEEDTKNPEKNNAQILKMMKEEKLLRIAWVINDFEPDKINDRVYSILVEKSSNLHINVKIEHFIEALYEVFHFFWTSVTVEKVELIVIKFFLDLLFAENYQRVQNFIEEKSISKLAALVNIDINFQDPIRYDKRPKGGNQMNERVYLSLNKLKSFKIKDLRELSDQSFSMINMMSE